MLPLVEPATEERDSQILDFYESLGLAPPIAAWERAFGATCPPTMAATPWVAHRSPEGVLAVAATHPAEVFLLGESTRASLVAGLAVAPGKPGEEASRALFEEVTGRAPLVFGVASSADSMRHFRLWNWRFVGPFSRFLFQPRSRFKSPPELSITEHDAPDVNCDDLTRLLTGDGAQFFPRSSEREDYLAAHRGGGKTRWIAVRREGEAAGWVRARRVASGHSSGREWLVEDIRGGLAADGALAEGLAVLAQSSGHPVYATFLRPHLAEECVRAGAEALAPRWGLFATVGRGGGRHFLEGLDATRPWAISAADVELDFF